MIIFYHSLLFFSNLSTDPSFHTPNLRTPSTLDRDILQGYTISKITIEVNKMTQTCPFCYKSIDINAIKCPYCCSEIPTQHYSKDDRISFWLGNSIFIFSLVAAWSLTESLISTIVVPCLTIGLFGSIWGDIKRGKQGEKITTGEIFFNLILTIIIVIFLI